MLMISECFAQPFTLGVDQDRVLVTVEGAAGDHPLLRTEAAIAWLDAHPGRHVVLDVTQVGLLNSALASWIIALAQASAPRRVQVQGANARVECQFRHLRLDLIVDLRWQPIRP